MIDRHFHKFGKFSTIPIDFEWEYHKNDFSNPNLFFLIFVFNKARSITPENFRDLANEFLFRSEPP